MIHYLHCSAPEVLKSGGFRIRKARSKDERIKQRLEGRVGVVITLRGHEGKKRAFVRAESRQVK